ncbi:MAG: type IV secretion system DNA-binding domain-containing protein [Gammaproteobacteria bacterium]|nr:type IV secretion system DNA-binding domain-containing protein [Gammaproteobacteria bacterium]
MAKTYRGVLKSQEFKTKDAVRDLRPFWIQARDLIKGRYGAIGFIGVMALCMFFMPMLTDLFFVLALIVFWYSTFTFVELPYKMPAYSNLLDRNDPLPGSKNPGPAAGIYYFGNDDVSKEQLWFSNSDMRTHVLIFGSTGSGKTEALLSIAFNALAQGSGFIYVDGKGDNSLFAKVFSMVRSMGREDDLLLINFMTGAADIIGPQSTVLSNTMNPFAAGSSSMLTELVVSLMDSGGGPSGGDGDMWKGRAISFVSALMRPLVWMRDRGYLLLEAGLIRRYFTLDAVEELLYDRKVIDQNNNITIMPETLPFEVRDPLENYLATLPGYQKSEKGKQSGKVFEQHGYITMQLTKIFGSLADVYAHIVRTNLAEVDFHDVVLNRRILVVLLPALEKSPDELSNLGKLIIASLKAMLAGGLGSQVEGDYRDVIERKPTNSKTPFLCILDEYGYYAVKGFAVVPAQARSLGFSVVFAGQDLPAFQKGGKEEAASICANTNIKICMKLEDPLETWDFFQKTAGESYISVARNFSRSGGGGALHYKDTMEASLDKRNRIDLLDLKDQREGEGHIFFKSNIVRARMFYANPPKVEKIKLNQFLKVKGPSDKSVTLVKSLSEVQIKFADFKGVQPEGALVNLISIMGNEALAKDRKKLTNAIIAFVQGKKEEEKVDFGDQSINASIFMFIKVEERLSSRFFDIETSTLLPSILTKEKLYEVVKRLNILIGKSESLAKEESFSMIDEIERQTSYADCLPKRVDDLVNKFKLFV